jgi:endonuclease III
MATVNWKKEIQPLIKKYRGKKHPLDYHTTYELMVMVILSAQDSDRNINKLAPALFSAFPNLAALAKADAESIYPFISKVRNYRNKTKWLMQVAATLKKDKDIPTTLEALTALPGIGRKSANVIMRELGIKAERIIVDLHVVRVAPRLGIATGTDPKKIEKQMMEILDPKDWGQVGMAISFLGREICRPKNPKCPECIMNNVCAYFGESEKLKVKSEK